MARIRLRSLKLTGFKSFPDEVELAFPSKVSAIIGPNGCGKSNLVDAILWVLGEQRTSLMRLKQMGDVVFTGAASRQPAGAAEVSLVLESDDGHWQETDGRLEVRRRVFRTGPSEYRLNGKSVRLKDVFDQLAEVGLGTRAYSIIEQGRVGQVLSARPIDRRALLEEAAGITRYKARKHEAELKLEHTRQNLLRLEDVIGEVKRTLRQIKRQAKQAERHQKLETDLKDHLRRLFTIDAHLLDRQRQDVQKRRAQAQNEVAAAAAGLAGSDADLGRAREDLEAARAATEKAREEVATLLGSKERLEAFLERSADLLDNLRASLDHTRNESATLQSSRGSLDGRITDARQRTAALQGELDTVREGVTKAEEAHQKSDALRTEAEQDAAQQRQDLLRTISTLTGSRNRLGDLERERDRLSYSIGQLAQDRTRLGERHQELKGSVQEATDKSRAASQVAEELSSKRRKLSDERARIRDDASTAKQEAESLGHSLWELRHRLQGVQREIARHTAAAEQLANLAPAEEMAGQLGDYLRPSPELAPVLDRVWREWLELPVIRSTSLSPEQLEALAGHEGRIRLIASSEAPPPPDLEPPHGAEDLILSAGVATEHLGWLTRALPRTLSCEDPARARELADELPDAVIVCGDGVIRHGRILEPKTRGDRHPGALQLRTMEQELEADINHLSSRTEAIEDRRQRTAVRLEEQSAELASLESEAINAEQERARTAAVEESLMQELGRVERELDSLAAEEERCRLQSEEAEARHTRLQEEVAKLESRSVELEQAVEDAANRLAGRREETAEALRELDRRKAEARLAEERTEAARAEAARFEEEAGALENRVNALEIEAGRLLNQQTGTEDEVVHSRTRLVEEQGLLAAAREHERRLAEKVDEIMARVSKLEKEVRVRRETHDREREVLHNIEVERTRAEADWERVSEHAADELGLAIESLLEVEPEADDEPEALRTDIEALRAKIERLGPVNLLALKELDELEERSQFLSHQRKDLVEALKSLDETIREIDATCTERFVATFEQVNEVFAETFSSLFGGGTARLDLVDEDDPLESGIDITAQPPGKKNQSVQLLSGGEKALTALSLLISLFRIKPSPFCILDEVDAPLDDANVERFADLVHAMTEHTQFVLITHNRRTMTRADLLYGVTMEEPGVSKIVSVRVEDPEKRPKGEALLP
jgi:chromosome segregation protein